MKEETIKYPYEVKYTEENIWVWTEPNLGHWKLNNEQIKKIKEREAKEKRIKELLAEIKEIKSSLRK